jgi:transcriptional regulator with XRE-family HTH domain
MSGEQKTPSGRLSEAGVREVRTRRAAGQTYQDIANAMGISQGTVYNIVKGKTWKWLQP